MGGEGEVERGDFGVWNFGKRSDSLCLSRVSLLQGKIEKKRKNRVVVLLTWILVQRCGLGEESKNPWGREGELFNNKQQGFPWKVKFRR